MLLPPPLGAQAVTSAPRFTPRRPSAPPATPVLSLRALARPDDRHRQPRRTPTDCPLRSWVWSVGANSRKQSGCSPGRLIRSDRPGNPPSRPASAAPRKPEPAARLGRGHVRRLSRASATVRTPVHRVHPNPGASSPDAAVSLLLSSSWLCVPVAVRTSPRRSVYTERSIACMLFHQVASCHGSVVGRCLSLLF